MSLVESLAKLPREKLVSQSGHGCASGEAFRVVYEGKPYKIRVCRKQETAERLKMLIQKIEPLGVIPKFYGCEGNVMVFEYVNGKELKRNEPFETLKELGKVIATLESITAENIKPQELDSIFQNSITYMLCNNLITEKVATRLSDKFYALMPTELDYSIGYYDIWPHNFKRTERGILIVDEESIKPFIKGCGLVKPFSYWFNSQQRTAFEEGYKEIAPLNSFLENEEFFTILMLTKYLKNRHERGAKLKLYPLLKIIGGKQDEK